MGDLGQSELQVWLVGAALQEAPWLDGDEDLVTRAQITGQLPPGLTDWLNAQLNDLNQLSSGN